MKMIAKVREYNEDIGGFEFQFHENPSDYND